MFVEIDDDDPKAKNIYSAASLCKSLLNDVDADPTTSRPKLFLPLRYR